MGLLYPDTSKGEEFGPIPVGSWPAKITSAAAGQSQSGNPKCEVHFDVTVDGRVRPRQAHLPVSGAASLRFDKLLRACKLAEQADKFRQGNGGEFDTDILVGQELIVVITHGINNRTGKPQDEIDSFLPA